MVATVAQQCEHTNATELYYALKNIKILNFMLGILYHNLKNSK